MRKIVPEPAAPKRSAAPAGMARPWHALVGDARRSIHHRPLRELESPWPPPCGRWMNRCRRETDSDLNRLNHAAVAEHLGRCHPKCPRRAGARSKSRAWSAGAPDPHGRRAGRCVGLGAARDAPDPTAIQACPRRPGRGSRSAGARPDPGRARARPAAGRPVWHWQGLPRSTRWPPRAARISAAPCARRMASCARSAATGRWHVLAGRAGKPGRQVRAARDRGGDVSCGGLSKSRRFISRRGASGAHYGPAPRHAQATRSPGACWPPTGMTLTPGPRRCWWPARTKAPALARRMGPEALFPPAPPS